MGQGGPRCENMMSNHSGQNYNNFKEEDKMKYSVPKRMLCWAVTASVAMSSMPVAAFAETGEVTDGTPSVGTKASG